jgi:EAL domain-containing protein (putative c-di-GMP-specific phosphodiesterase class I)
VTSIIGFASDIGAAVVADGVETEREIEMLRGLGIDLAQGNYLARPGQIPGGGGAWGRTALSADPTGIAT